MTARLAALLALTACLALPAAVSAAVYSWKDASGKVHYGSQPPAGQGEARKLAAPPPPTADQEAAQKAAAERQMIEREKQQKTQEEAQKSQEDQAMAKERAENCRQAKAALAALESGQARYTLNDKGERVALDGAVRDAELAKARKNADSWCKPLK
jgi:type IV secretory pathway VirB10-like protein